MGFNPGANLYVGSFGMKPENVEVPTYRKRNPFSTDINFPVGKRWINTILNAEYALTSLTSVANVLTATWTLLGVTTGNINTLTGNSGTATPVVGNILVAGTSNQIVAAGSSGLLNLSLASAITTPGSLTTTTTLTGGTGVTATTGNITATNGNFVKGTAGNKDIYTSLATTATAGANSAGTVTLVGGTATITTTAVTAASKIRTSRQSVGSTGANPTGNLSIGTINPSVSFIINSVSATDTTALATTDVSVIFWEIVN